MLKKDSNRVTITALPHYNSVMFLIGLVMVMYGQMVAGHALISLKNSKFGKKVDCQSMFMLLWVIKLTSIW